MFKEICEKLPPSKFKKLTAFSVKNIKYLNINKIPILIDKDIINNFFLFFPLLL